MTAGPRKQVGDNTYVHFASRSQLDATDIERVRSAEKISGIEGDKQYNLIRAHAGCNTISLLNYPGFFADPFPALRECWLVDLDAGSVAYRTYAESLNPPILHRKELLLPADHPRRAEFAALTEACESVGLFDEPTRIGYRRQWEQLVREKGYRIVGHQLVPIGNDEAPEGGEAGSEECPDAAAPLHAGWQAARQLTALQRYGLSAPVQSLARYGFLDGGLRVFDYGCGRGDDVRGLRENGIEAAGWDPYYAPDNPIAAADMVNLGFVVNVIEDFDERLEALTRAWSLTRGLPRASHGVRGALVPLRACRFR
jgi:hypothetical protein